MHSILSPNLLESSRFVRSAMTSTFFALPWLVGFLSAPLIIQKTKGLIAAPFTPMNPDRSVNLDAIEGYANWLHTNGVVGATLLCLLCQHVACAQSFMESRDVFPAGMNGIALYRIPGIVATTKGTVLAYCEARRNDKSDWGEIEVHLRRSTDGGKTWQA